MRKYLVLIVLLIAALTHSLIHAKLPESKQATLIENVSSSEVLVEATGIYKNKKKKEVEKYGVSRATDDAKKAAVYFVLYGGTDPMLRNSAEIKSMEPHIDYFFDKSNVSRYISYEDTQLLSKVISNKGQEVRISKRFKVNKEIIRRDLENFKIIDSRQELAEAVGLPQLMVIPEVGKGVNPIDELRNNPILKHAASVVESHLTAKKYDVIVPQQIDAINTLADAQQMLGDRSEDLAYKLALSIGSDVYITYSGAYENSGYNTKKYAMNVRAYETTTGRLLGAETGYSQGRQGETMVSIEEAMNTAIDNVLSRIENYWRDDVQNGIQYKLVISIDPSLSEDEVLDIQDLFMDVIDKYSKRSKENIATKQTLDYLIWCDPLKYDNSRRLLRDVRREFDNSAFGSKLKPITTNRKLILLKIE
ncbi:MAG: DUF6175 family protein [Candidatus Cloacimonadales bacterium]|jgi:hypothetical protein|nr:DUF6175 family protein [Candidatus Cloacimonadota bacterium]MDD2649703.1 DUF6175 family protein [Candidatus Cloacimonadota bacterium]MDX9976807.1 DUF6175 family protein [Candidatus Cloacimonadales bacterium]